MKYYQYNKYPIEFVLSENIDKHFDFHNHVRHYIISMVMQGTVEVYLKNRKLDCSGGDVFIVPPYAMHSVRQGQDVRLLSMCVGTAFIEEMDFETIERIVGDLLRDMVKQGIIGKEQREKLLFSVRMLYSRQAESRKEMDLDIKTLIDKMTSQPEQDLPIEALAAEIFTSKYYLIRKFKKSIGMTPHQFCIQNRIRKSQRLSGRSI